MEDEKDNNNFLILDDKGMVVEQSKAFSDNIIGDICDIIQRSKKYSEGNEMVVSIQYEKSNLVLVNDPNKKISVCSLSNK